MEVRFTAVVALRPGGAAFGQAGSIRLAANTVDSLDSSTGNPGLKGHCVVVEGCVWCTPRGDVIQLDVVDTSTSPNLPPSCDFCKWSTGKYWHRIRHFGYNSRRKSFISADIENDLHCESEVALGVCTVLYT